MLKKPCTVLGLIILSSCSGGGAYVDRGAPYDGPGNYYYSDRYYPYRYYDHHDGKHRKHGKYHHRHKGEHHKKGKDH